MSRGAPDRPASKSYADVRAWVAARDPELAAAEADVDETLLAEAERLPLLEHVRRCVAASRIVSRRSEPGDE